MLENNNYILNFYNNKYKIKRLRKLKFKTFKKIVPLNLFKKAYLHDFYSDEQLEKVRKLLNVNHKFMQRLLVKRYILEREIERKYYKIFFPKRFFPNRFIVRNRISYFKKKKKKRNIRLRLKFFFRINYDNFLFYLNIQNKQFIIKPFNFLGSLFFYQTRRFKKNYTIHKRRKRRFFRFFYRYRRRRRKKRFMHRRNRFLPYRFKKKTIMKKVKKLKIRRFVSFFKFIAFLKICKKKNLVFDDNFKIKSISFLPYKLLKLNFNKINNSYDFFINFNNSKRDFNFLKIRSLKTNKKKTKLYNLIKYQLMNKKQNNIKSKEIIKLTQKQIKINTLINKLNILKKNKQLVNEMTLTNDLIFLENNLIYKKPSIKIIDLEEKFNYLSYSFLIKNLLFTNTQIEINKKLFKIIKMIKKLSQKISFFEQKNNNIKLKKKKLSRLFLKKLLFNKNFINKIYKFKYIFMKLLNIINFLKEKMKKLVLNFHLINSTINNNETRFNKNSFFFKINYFLKKKKYKKKLILFSILFSRKYKKPKKRVFKFSFKNKINNKPGLLFGKPKPWWRKKKKRRRKLTKRRQFLLKRVNNILFLSNFNFYKNDLINTKYLKKILYRKKSNYKYLNFLTKTILINSKKNQINKNINFLK